MTEPNMDQDALDAALDLVGRTGAREIEIGYQEDRPVGEHVWYAHASYQGARITVEKYVGPVEATEALARRLLDGGMCTYCGKTIALAGSKDDRCRWTRQGSKWVRGCESTHHKREHMPKERL